MKNIKLNNGIDIPLVGLGTFLSTNDEVYQAVLHALKNGYKHIDTAAVYGNEEEVGNAIINSGVKREDIFLTTKVWNSVSDFDETIKAFEESISKLQTKYLDLYLVHWPGNYDRFCEVWRAFEYLYNKGKVRSIGVSNFNVHHIDYLLTKAKIKPVVNQIECNVKLQNQFLVDYCAKLDIIVQAYSPMRSHQIKEILENKTLSFIGEKYGKNPVQVALRWLIERDIVVLPKSITSNRIDDNINIFDFSLSTEDMKLIRNLNSGMRLFPEPDNIDFGFYTKYSGNSVN